MIDIWIAATSAPRGASAGQWVLIVALAVLFFAVRAQLDPIRRCTLCHGKPPSTTGGGRYHRCPRCKGAPERLTFAAWLMRKLGIPVPRAKPSAKENRWWR